MQGSRDGSRDSGCETANVATGRRGLECGGVTGAVGLSSCQRMLYARLESDVDQTEDAEQRRLEAGASDATGRGVAAACVRALPEVAARAPEMEGIGGQTEARAELVTGYAEHRASLQEKKNYRRAIKIDLKLPEASTALAGVPRRKDFAEGEEGRLWRGRRSSMRTRAISRTLTSVRRR